MNTDCDWLPFGPIRPSRFRNHHSQKQKMMLRYYFIPSIKVKKWRNCGIFVILLIAVFGSDKYLNTKVIIL